MRVMSTGGTSGKNTQAKIKVAAEIDRSRTIQLRVRNQERQLLELNLSRSTGERGGSFAEVRPAEVGAGGARRIRQREAGEFGVTDAPRTLAFERGEQVGAICASRIQSDLSRGGAGEEI